MTYWSEELEFGVKEIDDQHKQLCMLANRLFNAFVDGKMVDEINLAMAYFEKYVKEHFDAEESVQREINYPEYALHKQEHDEFKSTIQRFKFIIENSGIDEKFIKEFNSKIINWLVFHLRECDQKVAVFIKNKKYQKSDSYLSISDIIKTK